MMLKSPFCASAMGTRSEMRNPARSNLTGRKRLQTAYNIRGPTTTSSKMLGQDGRCLQYVSSSDRSPDFKRAASENCAWRLAGLTRVGSVYCHCCHRNSCQQKLG